jgi:hypothetical protein
MRPIRTLTSRSPSSSRTASRPGRIWSPCRPGGTEHIRFNQLTDPEPIPNYKDYASVLESDVPVVVQHTRLDSRQAELALISTIVYAGD